MGAGRDGLAPLVRYCLQHHRTIQKNFCGTTDSLSISIPQFLQHFKDYDNEKAL